MGQAQRIGLEMEVLGENVKSKNRLTVVHRLYHRNGGLAADNIGVQPGKHHLAVRFHRHAVPFPLGGVVVGVDVSGGKFCGGQHLTVQQQKRADDLVAQHAGDPVKIHFCRIKQLFVGVTLVQPVLQKGSAVADQRLIYRQVAAGFLRITAGQRGPGFLGVFQKRTADHQNAEQHQADQHEKCQQAQAHISQNAVNVVVALVFLVLHGGQPFPLFADSPPHDRACSCSFYLHYSALRPLGQDTDFAGKVQNNFDNENTDDY